MTFLLGISGFLLAGCGKNSKQEDKKPTPAPTRDANDNGGGRPSQGSGNTGNGTQTDNTGRYGNQTGGSGSQNNQQGGQSNPYSPYTPNGPNGGATSGQNPQQAGSGQVLFFMGGFNSCSAAGASAGRTPLGTTLYQKSNAVLSNQEKSQYLLTYSCFGTDPNQVTVYHPKTNSMETISVSQFLSNSVSQINQAYPGSSIHIMGHSYGGNLALLLSNEFIKRGSQIETLITIDPISPIQCIPASYITYAIGQMINYGNGGKLQENPGCDRAPASGGTLNLMTIRGQTDRWSNFYQTEFIPLHSSAINEAHENRLLSSGGTASRDFHTEIQESDEIWTLFRNSVR
ncbi:MAG: hypothetical protein HQK54_17825 [Oligoflexales bacterium]|nr:hypothetical protein [Oligoflexales bacterium]